MARYGDENNYRIQPIGRHIKSCNHRLHHDGPHNTGDLVLNDEELEYIRLLELKFTVKKNLAFDVFRFVF